MERVVCPLLSFQSTAFLPTVENTKGNMPRHASVYAQSSPEEKINQRSNIYQQKATREIHPMSLLKGKFAFLQLQRIENKFDHEDWNYAKDQKARKKLQCERSPGEF